jgi:uncharacterized protein
MNEMYEISGLLFGMIFGALLQRAHILRFDNQLSMLLLNNFRVLKYLLTASVVGACANYLLYQYWLIEIVERPLWLYPMLIGGVIFGIGWAILGYCPGTALGALGEGRYDALFGFLGGLLAVFVYDTFVHGYLIGPLFKSFEIAPDNLPLNLLHVNPWVILVPLCLASLVLFWWLERRKL